MTRQKEWLVALALTLSCGLLALRTSVACEIPASAKQLNPIEVGFCESDAVFVGKVEQKIQTSRAFTEPGSDKTKHFATQRSTVKVHEQFKGATLDTVTLISELYDKDRAYEFESTKTYLIFAKKLAGPNEFAGASERCSVQPTLLIEDAKKALKRLTNHAKGKNAIDCGAVESLKAQIFKDQNLDAQKLKQE